MKATCEIIDVFLLILSVFGQSTAAPLEEPGRWISAVSNKPMDIGQGETDQDDDDLDFTVHEYYHEFYVMSLNFDTGYVITLIDDNDIDSTCVLLKVLTFI